MMTHASIPTLTTARLTLRAPVREDYDAFSAFYAGDRSGFVGGPLSAGRTFTGFCALWGHWELRGYGRWIIADKTTNAALGLAGPFYPDGWPEPELAWTLFDGAEGKGIAYEATLAAREYAYSVLGWTDCVSLVDPSNTRSLALAARLGCVPDGTHEHTDFGTLHLHRHPSAAALSLEAAE